MKLILPVHWLVRALPLLILFAPLQLTLAQSQERCFQIVSGRGAGAAFRASGMLVP